MKVARPWVIFVETYLARVSSSFCLHVLGLMVEPGRLSNVNYIRQVGELVTYYLLIQLRVLMAQFLNLCLRCALEGSRVKLVTCLSLHPLSHFDSGCIEFWQYLNFRN